MPTYTLISSVTVGAGGASSIDFTSIPSTYTDLCLKASVRGTASYAYSAMKVTYNGSTTNYSAIQIYGDGSSATSNNYTDAWVGYVDAATATSNTFSSTEIYIPNYAGSTNKSSSVDFVQENNTTSALAGMLARLWSSTAAISSITFSLDSGNFAQYSTATLYGISNS